MQTLEVIATELWKSLNLEPDMVLVIPVLRSVSCDCHRNYQEASVPNNCV